jgi:uncharacterized membrane protein
MNRFLAATTLTAALALAGGIAAQAAEDMPQVVKDNMMRAKAQHLEKCYGVNAVAKNDCAEGAHSCAGQATMPRDPKSFVLLPAGDCAKLAGGKTMAS